MKLKDYFWIGKSLLSNRPSYAIFFITARCNARCKFCFYTKNIENASQKKELNLEEIKKIAKNLGNLPYLTLSGGEPFLRKDIVEICKIFSKYAKTRIITIPTNGGLTEKIEKDVKALLKECKNVHFNIRISLDNLGEKHNKIRNTPNLFEKALKTYKKLIQLKNLYKNFNLDISTTFSIYNQDDVKELFDYIKKNTKVDHHYLGPARTNLIELTNVPIKKYEKVLAYARKITANKEKRPLSSLFYALDELNTDIILKTIKEKKKQQNCVAGKKLIVISETGEIYPCEMLGKSFGNVRNNNYDIIKMLNSKKGQEIRNWIKKTKCFCIYGCANYISFFYNPKMYPKLAKLVLKRTFKK